MKFIEKYHQDFGDGAFPVEPDSEAFVSFVCPSRFGYEPDSYACDYMRSCEECWNREMQEKYYE